MRNTQSGVTLVELMVAMLIVVVLGALAMVAYEGYTETARLGEMRQKIEGFRIFQDNYHVDNGTYIAGTYDPEAGTNDFSGNLGYRIPGDSDGVSLEVTACDGGTIDDCYKVVATSQEGYTVTWNDGEFLDAP